VVAASEQTAMHRHYPSETSSRWRSVVPKISALTMVAAVACSMATGVQAADNATICRQLNLSPTALSDCEERMATSLTGADRAKVIRTFATGLASARADALIGQLSVTSAPSQSASKEAPTPSATADTGAQKTTATGVTPDLATPQKKATATGGGERTGTKAGPQHTHAGSSADQPLAKPKGQKMSHQPVGKNIKK
jgi:hypothetical protein